ncbi:MAG: DUF6544 family protein [Devosia sp.]
MALLAYVWMSAQSFADRVELMRENMVASQQTSVPARDDIPEIMRRYALKAGGTASGPEFAKGELMRYLSELPLYPDAILNAQGLTWRQTDDTTVEASAQSAHGPAALRFLFDGNGDVVAMQADDRPMTVGDTTVPTPWHGIYSKYKQFGPYRIPSYGEVGWGLKRWTFHILEGRNRRL